LNVSGSGRLVYGVAFDSSAFDASGAFGSPLGPRRSDVMPISRIVRW